MPARPLPMMPTMAGVPAPAIDEAMIERLVHHFYDRVREDDLLAPIFARAILDDWAPHLATMIDFWSSVMLTSGRFKGHPVATHRALGALDAAHFERWLALFADSADTVCPPAAAAVFKDRAQRIAASLRRAVDHPTAPAPTT